MSTLLEIDRGTLESNFGREPFELHHTLSDHPLLTVDAIADLAGRLPEDHIEHNLGNVPEVLPGVIERSITRRCQSTRRAR